MERGKGGRGGGGGARKIIPGTIDSISITFYLLFSWHVSMQQSNSADFLI